MSRSRSPPPEAVEGVEVCVGTIDDGVDGTAGVWARPGVALQTMSGALIRGSEALTEGEGGVLVSRSEDAVGAGVGSRTACTVSGLAAAVAGSSTARAGGGVVACA